MKCIACSADVDPVFVIRESGPGLACPSCTTPMAYAEASCVVTPQLEVVQPEPRILPAPAGVREVKKSDIVAMVRSRLSELEIEIADLDTKRAEADMLRKMLGVVEKVKANGASAQ